MEDVSSLWLKPSMNEPRPPSPTTLALASLPQRLAQIDALYNSTAKLLHEAQKTRLATEKQIVMRGGMARIHPAVLRSNPGAATRSKSRSRDFIADNVKSQGRPRGQLIRVLRQVDGQIDGPLRARLRDGTIRLLRCSWLQSDDTLIASHAVDMDSVTGNLVIKRHQAIPEDAFLSPEDAVELLDRGDRSILCLSHGWLTKKHPDPHGSTLQALRRHLNLKQNVGHCGVFWSWCSVPQRDPETGERTKEEEARYQKAVEIMASVYASIKGSAVLQVKDASIPETMAAHRDFYNVTPFEDRGWCVFEEGAGVSVEAHLAWAKKERRLPNDLRRAMHARAKVTDITRGRSRHVNALDRSPEEVLKAAKEALSTALFSDGDEDKDRVGGLLSGFNETIQQAIIEPPTSVEEVPVDAHQTFLKQRPVFSPAGPATPGARMRPLKAGGEGLYSRPASAGPLRSPRTLAHSATGSSISSARPQSAAGTRPALV